MFIDLNWSHALAGTSGSAATFGAIALVRALSRSKFRMSFGNGNGNGNGHSPESSLLEKFTSLDMHAQTQTRILEQQTALMQEHTKLLTELVTVSRMRTGAAGGRI